MWDEITDLIPKIQGCNSWSSGMEKYASKISRNGVKTIIWTHVDLLSNRSLGANFG